MQALIQVLSGGPLSCLWQQVGHVSAAQYCSLEMRPLMVYGRVRMPARQGPYGDGGGGGGEGGGKGGLHTWSASESVFPVLDKWLM